MKSYTVGYIKLKDLGEVLLQEIDEDGNDVGDPVMASEWKISGKLVADDRGRVVYVESKGTSDPKDKD